MSLVTASVCRCALVEGGAALMDVIRRYESLIVNVGDNALAGSIWLGGGCISGTYGVGELEREEGVELTLPVHHDFANENTGEVTRDTT